MRERGESFEDHVMRRARERYGLTLDLFDYRVLVACIQQDRGKFVVRQSPRVTVWRVRHRGAELLAVYDQVFRRITTVLDPRTKFKSDGRQDWRANRRLGIE